MGEGKEGAVPSVGWFVSLLVREEVLLADLGERKILFRLKIYDRLRQATAKQTGWAMERSPASVGMSWTSQSHPISTAVLDLIITFHIHCSALEWIGPTPDLAKVWLRSQEGRTRRLGSGPHGAHMQA